MSVACEQAGEEYVTTDMIWGVQGGGSDRNMQGMDDYYAATARIPDKLISSRREGRERERLRSVITLSHPFPGHNGQTALRNWE